MPKIGLQRYAWLAHVLCADTRATTELGQPEGMQGCSWASPLSQRLRTSECLQAHFGGDNTDAFYIPAHLAADFQLAAAAFAHKNMLAEIAIPAILGIITEGPQDFQVNHWRAIDTSQTEDFSYGGLLFLEMLRWH